ncbi:hypothetical protein GCM10027277_03360 [Pseudoduganella ginsengisoli]|uniref:Uncharacterized protein n=1 Tax=Pseudoduganella ginsengisoli TaxID=1462440 RepID=A0A6L6Q676_9BURK|nr:glycoside hydrolase family 25 protein [Pseudoduganella ginsengisoli]MTW04771.1 hypothetical protein [Pseudoduganella ginsengisoli]
MLKGIDVYAGDGAIEWHRVADDGNAFAFVRGAYGDTLDKSAPPNAAAARAVGMKVGVYHFFRARIDPKIQLQTLIQALDLANVGPGDLPPVIDIEDNPKYDGPWDTRDNAAYLAGVADWVAQVHQRIGRAPIIYTRASFWAQLDNPAGYSACPLWVASYRPDTPTLPSGWPAYAFWQYSDAGTVQGVAGHADVNYFNGDAARLKTLLI